MPSTTSYSFGDVVLVPFPFTDQTTSKKRPAVVVSSNRYNTDRPDVILMAITSHQSTRSRFGEVLVTDVNAAGLLKASTIKPIITTIEKTLIVRALGKLQRQDLTLLENSLSMIIGGH